MGVKDRLARVPVLGTALRVQERYVDDAADSLAAAIGFYGFLSLFPLVAIALSVAGFVFRGDEARLLQVAEAVEGAIPALSATMGEGSGVSQALQGVTENAGSLLSIGSLLLLVSGMRVVAGAQRASAVVFRREVPKGFGARSQQVAALLGLGVLALVGAAVGGSIGIDAGSASDLVRSLLITVVTFGLDLGLFVAAYKLLTPGDGPPIDVVLPGALLAAVGWSALKLFGVSFIASQGDNPVYAGIGSVVGLLVLLYLAGRLYVYGAELSALLAGIDPPDLGTGPGGPPEPEPAPVPDTAPAVPQVVRFTLTGLALGFLGSRVAGWLDQAVHGDD